MFPRIEVWAILRLTFASLAPAQIDVRAGAVLLPAATAKHQTTSTVPQPTDKAGSRNYCLVEVTEKKLETAR